MIGSTSPRFVPIVFGVTGHRDIKNEDYGKIRLSVKGLFEAYKEKYSSSPFYVLTALAEGADRIVAEVAIELDIPLVAVLPLPSEEYMKDFESGASKKQFNDLLANSVQILYAFATNYTTINPDYSDSRVRQGCYEGAGRLIADKAQVLIALWDGTYNNAPGGTSEIVRYKLSEFTPKILDPYGLNGCGGVGNVTQIYTRRNNENENDCKIGLVIEHGENLQDGVHDTLSGILLKIDTLNKEIRENSDESKNKMPTCFRELGIEFDYKNEAVQSLVIYLNQLDNLSGYFKKKRMRSLNYIFSLAVSSFVVFNVYSEIITSVYMLIAFPVLFLLAYGVYRHSVSKKYEYKYQDYRSITEAIRIQFYWWQAGIYDIVYKYYVLRFRSEVDWIRTALNNIYFMCYDLSNQPNYNPSIERSQKVLNQWVVSQKDYYGSTLKRNLLSHRAYEKYANALFILSFFFAILLILFELFHPSVQCVLLEHTSSFHSFIVLTITVLICVSATMIGYAEKMSFSEIAKRYEQMFYTYSIAARELRWYVDNNELTKSTAVLLELGKESLSENVDWLLLQRSKPIEIPKG